MRHKTIYPEGWKPAKGYANGVLATGATLHIAGQIGWNAEKKFTSDIYEQGWEFYTSTLCLFLVFALPGFIYRFDLKHLLQRPK